MLLPYDVIRTTAREKINMKLNKILLGIISITCSILAFVLPFVISKSSDSYLSILSTSFTGLGAIASLFTLVIALILYQRFGIESRFIERQTDKTLELVDIIKGKVINVKTKKYNYFLRFKIDDKNILKEKFYDYLNPKIIIIKHNDYEIFTRSLYEIRKSYWLPKEIKEKMGFLIIYGHKKLSDDSNSEKYARLNFENDNSGDYVLPMPEMTVADYIKKKNELTKSIENWLSKHSDIKIDLKLEEPNQEFN